MARKKGKVLGTDFEGVPHQGKAFNASSLNAFRLSAHEQYLKMREEKKAALIARLRSSLKRDGLKLDDDDSESDWEDEGVIDMDHPDMEMLERAMQGQEEVELSNAGGEFEELVKTQLLASQKKRSVPMAVQYDNV